MKKLIIAVAVASTLSACGSNPVSQYTKEAEKQIERQERAVKIAINEAPDWMTKVPKSPNAVYETGTASHIDFSMADMIAKTMAYAKICTAAGGTVRSQTKVFGNNSGITSEITARSMCPDIDITGVETVDVKHVAEGNRIRTYVLVALPTGPANVLRTSREAEKRAPEAFKELDKLVEKPKAQ